MPRDEMLGDEPGLEWKLLKRRMLALVIDVLQAPGVVRGAVHRGPVEPAQRVVPVRLRAGFHLADAGAQRCDFLRVLHELLDILAHPHRPVLGKCRGGVDEDPGKAQKHCVGKKDAARHRHGGFLMIDAEPH
jgi:hypothetical protein